MSAPAATCSTATPAGPRSSSPVGRGGGGGGMAGDGAGDGAQPSHLGAETPTKPITVTVEEKRVQRVKPGADVTFICTAKSKVSWGGMRAPVGAHYIFWAPVGAFWVVQGTWAPLGARWVVQGTWVLLCADIITQAP